MNRDEVLRIARLARLRLAPEQIDGFVRDLTSIVADFDRLRAIDVSSVTDAEILVPNPGQSGTIFRPDEPRPERSLDATEAMQNVDDTERFRVPAYFEGDSA